MHFSILRFCHLFIHSRNTNRIHLRARARSRLVHLIVVIVAHGRRRRLGLRRRDEGLGAAFEGEELGGERRVPGYCCGERGAVVRCGVVGVERCDVGDGGRCDGQGLL